MSEGNNIAIQNLSYVREVDNNNLLSGELEKLSNLPHLFLLVSSACKQSLTRFGHRIYNACCASLFASLQANKCVTCGKIAFSKQFYPRPLLARRGIVWILCCLFSFNVQAECTPTPDCADMGYTETSCDGKFVRCPFDTSKLFCAPCDSKFHYSCNEKNMTGGTGSSCNNKYVSCECVLGATFSNGNCICDTSCKVGNIYYSDGSCSSCIDDTKTVIGVVVKDNELVMSKEQKQGYWSSGLVNLSTLTDYATRETAIKNYSGVDNTAKIVEYYGTNADVNKNAAVYCYNFSPLGLENTKNNWYLPAAGELYDYVYSNWYALNNTYVSKLHWPTFSHYFWSSTEYTTTDSWVVNCNVRDVGWGNKVSTYYFIGCFLKI